MANEEGRRERIDALADMIDESLFRETRWGARGYNEQDVDGFLDILARELRALSERVGARPDVAGHDVVGGDERVPSGHGADVDGDEGVGRGEDVPFREGGPEGDVDADVDAELDTQIEDRPGAETDPEVVEDVAESEPVLFVDSGEVTAVVTSEAAWAGDSWAQDDVTAEHAPFGGEDVGGEDVGGEDVGGEDVTGVDSEASVDDEVADVEERASEDGLAGTADAVDVTEEAVFAPLPAVGARTAAPDDRPLEEPRYRMGADQEGETETEIVLSDVETATVTSISSPYDQDSDAEITAEVEPDAAVEFEVQAGIERAADATAQIQGDIGLAVVDDEVDDVLDVPEEEVPTQVSVVGEGGSGSSDSSGQDLAGDEGNDGTDEELPPLPPWISGGDRD